MKMIFDAVPGKLYDFIQIIAVGAQNINIIKIASDWGVNPTFEVIEAQRYIWEGLDKTTPGLETITAMGGNQRFFITSFFQKYVWQWRTVESFIENFQNMLQDELKYELLSFYDNEEHPIDYYKDILADSTKLYDFVYSLEVSDKIKLELLGITTGISFYTKSLVSLLQIIAKRLEDVYKKNAMIIDEAADKIKMKIRTNNSFFLTDEDALFARNYKESYYDEIHILVSFLNEALIYTQKNHNNLEVHLGVNYERFLTRFSVNEVLSGYGIFYKALSDESRVRIIELLRDHEMYIGEISRALTIPLTTLTYHIDMLRNAEIIKCRNEGKKTICKFDAARVDEAALTLCRYLGSNLLVNKQNNT